MTLLQRFLDNDIKAARLLSEAPVGDYAHQPSDPDEFRAQKRRGWNPVDKELAVNPTAIQRVKSKFAAKIPYTFNLYFAAIKGGSSWAETGAVDRNVLSKIGIDPKMVKEDPDAITIIYVGNAAGEKTPLTGWCMSHRLAHAMSRMTSGKAGTEGRGTPSRKSYGSWSYMVPSYKQFEESVERALQRLAGSALPKERSGYLSHHEERRYGATSRDGVLKNVGHDIGTMASARNRKLRNSAEFAHELFAQYVMTGNIKLKEYEGDDSRATSAVRGHAWGRPQRYGTGLSAGDANATVGYLEVELNGLAEQVLDECVGQVFVM